MIKYKQYLEIVDLYKSCSSFPLVFITYNISLLKWMILMNLCFYSKHFTGSPGAVITGKICSVFQNLLSILSLVENVT